MAKKKLVILLTFLLIPFLVSTSWGTPVLYISEATFLSDLALLGVPILAESFEDSIWDNPIPNPVINMGLSWSDGTAATIKLTSSTTYNHDGTRGIYDYDYPNKDVIFSSTTGLPLIGFGGWFKGADVGGGPRGSDINMTLDGGANTSTASAPLTWPAAGSPITGDWVFLGVIDTGGFTKIEMFSNTGDWGADDFHFAAAAVPEPVTMLLLGLGLIGLSGARRQMKS